MTKIPLEEFQIIIEKLRIPRDELLIEWWEAIRNLNASNLLHISSQINNLNNLLPQGSEEPLIPESFTYIFLAHCYNLGSYSGEKNYYNDAVACITAAIKTFKAEISEYHYILSWWYLGLLHFSIDAQESLYCLKKAHEEFIKLGENYREKGPFSSFAEIQALQIRIDEKINLIDKKYLQLDSTRTVNSFINSESLVEQFKQSIRLSNKPKAKPSSHNKTAEPEATPPIPFKKNEVTTSLPFLKLDNKSRLSDRKRPPETPQIPPPKIKNTGDENGPDVQLIVIPVDVKALEKTQINDAPVSGNLFEKLATYDEEYHRRKGSDHQQAPKKKTVLPPRVVIPSFPVRGYATANPKGKADLPSADGSLPFMAPEVDETMILNINGNSYQVHLLGRGEIHGSHRTHDWFHIDGDSMNIAEPIPIEDQDFVLFNKRNCNLQSCNGKIVLVSIRDVNIDPTRLLVKRFVVVSPKQYPGIHDTTYLLLSESRSKYKAMELTDEYKIEGEVVAIAKLTN